ncbi:cytochrome c biogenesis CcdA family protein [Streptococcus cameli]
MGSMKLVALFLEGALAFFSPCVLPILPIYLGILTNQGQGEAKKKYALANTLAFVIGISLTFFLMAFATSLLSRFFVQHSKEIRLLSGLLICTMAAFQLGWLKLDFLYKERSLKEKVYQGGKAVGPWLALLMGFTFSFSWTPCIGPILASVFLYASTHQGLFGVLMIFIYCLGFILPFLIIALFAEKLLVYLRQKSQVMRHTTLVSGVVLLLIGLSILFGFFDYFAY